MISKAVFVVSFILITKVGLLLKYEVVYPMKYIYYKSSQVKHIISAISMALRKISETSTDNCSEISVESEFSD